MRDEAYPSREEALRLPGCWSRHGGKPALSCVEPRRLADAGLETRRQPVAAMTDWV